MATMTLVPNHINQAGLHNLPTFVDESLVHPFKYWDEGVCQGMRYYSKLYKLLQVFPIDNRLKASDTACTYADQGKSVCITVSRTAYSVWIAL